MAIVKCTVSERDGVDLSAGAEEISASADLIAAKGIAFDGGLTTKIESTSGVLSFIDSATASASLADLADKIGRRTFDVTSLTTGDVITWNGTLSKFVVVPVSTLATAQPTTVVFSRNANVGVGVYFRLGDVSASTTGATIRGNTKIVRFSLSNASAMISATTVQIQKRTSITTWEDITGAVIVLPIGAYKAVADVSITLATDEEITAYNKSGGTLSHPVLTISVVPQ